MRQTSIKYTVSPSDIDKYNHLNNAAFPRYFEKARDYLALRRGLDADSLKPRELAFLVKRASYEYLRQVNAGEEIEIMSEVVSAEGARVIIEQKMFVNGLAAAKCNIEYFFLDIARQRPTRIPFDIKNKLGD